MTLTVRMSHFLFFSKQEGDLSWAQHALGKMRILPKLAFSNGHKQSRFEELDTTKVHLAASGGEYNEDVGKDLPDNDNSEIWSSQFTDV